MAFHCIRRCQHSDDPDDQVTIVDAREVSTPRLSDLGTSILILESLSVANGGNYFCEVNFGSGSINSTMGLLVNMLGE